MPARRPRSSPSGAAASRWSPATLMDDYVLGLPGVERPKVCFLPTASGDADHYIVRFYRAFAASPLRGRNMLAIWRVHELDAILRECWARGIVLAGLSAGAMCWFRAGITKSRGRAEPVAGLGLLDGSLSVHYDGEPERRPVFLQAVASGAIPDGFGADDGGGLLFRDGRLERVVSSRPAAGCVRVKRAGDRAVEQPVHVDLLADREPLVAVDPDVRELRATRYRSLRGGV